MSNPKDMLPATLEHRGDEVYEGPDGKFYLMMIDGEPGGHSGEATSILRIYDTEELARAYLNGVDDAINACDFKLRATDRKEFEAVCDAEDLEEEDDTWDTSKHAECERVKSELVEKGEASYEGQTIKAVPYGYTVTGHDHYQEVEDAMEAIDDGD